MKPWPGGHEIKRSKRGGTAGRAGDLGAMRLRRKGVFTKSTRKVAISLVRPTAAGDAIEFYRRPYRCSPFHKPRRQSLSRSQAKAEKAKMNCLYGRA
jgi:hypothetical protein